MKLPVFGVLVLLLSGFSAPAISTVNIHQIFSVSGNFDWRLTGTQYALEEGHIYFLGTLFGTFLAGRSTGGPWSDGVFTCPNWQDGPGATGYCIFSDADDDQIFMSWQCGNDTDALDLPPAIVSCAGAADIYAGTGKFHGIQGQATLVSQTTAAHPDGTWSGYVRFDANYRMPAASPGLDSG